MWNVATTEYWIDTIKYEMDFSEIKFAHILLKRAVKSVLGINIETVGASKTELLANLEEWKRKMYSIEISKLSNKTKTEKIIFSQKIVYRRL